METGISGAVNQKSWFILITAILSVLLLSTTYTQLAPNLGQAEAQLFSLTEAERNWTHINANARGDNYNPQTQLNKDNAQHLELKWVFPIPSQSQARETFGVGSTTEGTRIPPLIIDGVVYVMTGYRSIFALDAATGRTIWQWNDDHNETSFRIATPEAAAASHTQGHAMHSWDGMLVISGFGCEIQGIDLLTGKLRYNIGNEPGKSLCNDIPTNIPNHVYKQAGAHPAVFYERGRVVIYNIGGNSEGRGTARTYMAGFDYDSKQLLWRTFLQPPGKQCTGGQVKSSGPWGPDRAYTPLPGASDRGLVCEEFFTREKRAWDDWIVNNCDRGIIGGIPACDVPEDILRNDWGKGGPINFGPYYSGGSNAAEGAYMNSGISNVWGTYAVDEDLGMVYIGTSQPGGHDYNATFRPGPNLFGNTILGMDAMTGEIKWYVQSNPHDLWDVDCSWNTIVGEIDGRKVVYKGCKEGHINAIDAITGELIWVTEIPASWHDNHYAVCEAGPPACYAEGSNVGPGLGGEGRAGEGNKGRGPLVVDMKTPTNYLDPRSYADMTRPWANYPDLNTRWMAPIGSGILEADMAFDGERVYATIKNTPRWYNDPFGGSRFNTIDTPDFEVNSSVTAVDARTGAVLWDVFMKDVEHRGGVIVSGGMAIWNGYDGNIYMVDAETGAMILKKPTGTGLEVQPSIGADPNGNIILIQAYGGRSSADLGRSAVPGAVMAYGLPDEIPESQVEIREVQVPGPERVVEVEVERVVEVEKVVEVPVEVITTEEVISPLSFVAVGVGVVLVIISAVVFTRRKA